MWTYKLRPNVKFQNGQSFGADDVVVTYDRLSTRTSGSKALSALKGVLSPGGTKKIDNLTIEFHLDAPTANFPYLTSSTTYQAIILPANYRLGTFRRPRRRRAPSSSPRTPRGQRKVRPLPGLVGGHAALDGVDVTFYSDDAAVDLGVARKPDRPHRPDPVRDRPGAVQQLERADLHGPRGDTPARCRCGSTRRTRSRDCRVRQAIALTLDRPAIVKTLFNSLADVGNDSPFAPVYPSTDRSVPQRRKDLPLAKQLMAKAGYPKGFKITLTTEKVGEIPQLAQIIQRSVKAIGIDMKLVILTSTAYFAGSQDGPPTRLGQRHPG